MKTNRVNKIIWFLILRKVTSIVIGIGAVMVPLLIIIMRISVQHIKKHQRNVMLEQSVQKEATEVGME